MFFKRINHIHMMGIGGTGMSGMAEILLTHGFRVSGCDIQEQESLECLRRVGAAIQIGHHPEHVSEADVVVFSSAVENHHPELAAARRANIPTIKRAEMLGEITRLGFTIAVSGTHGKTTTTSMIGYLADRLGLDPTVIVGGRLISPPGHIRVGSGPCVVEADEYDHSLHSIHPTLAVMTNVDRDHLDCYHDLAEICQTFLAYLQEVPFFGKVILNADDPIQKTFIPEINRPIITYGKENEVDFKISEIVFSKQETKFTCRVAPADCRLSVRSHLFGEHNVYNATAALAAIWDATGNRELLDRAAYDLADFPGVSRRFETIGAFEGHPVISDYAHHPREIKAVIQSARQAFPDHRLTALFQPHLYSRTRIFSDDFATALFPCEEVIVLPVYPAREEPIIGVTGETVVHLLRQNGHGHAVFLPDIPSAFAHVSQKKDTPHVFLAIGAGSIHYHTVQFLEAQP